MKFREMVLIGIVICVCVAFMSQCQAEKSRAMYEFASECARLGGEFHPAPTTCDF